MSDPSRSRRDSQHDEQVLADLFDRFVEDILDSRAPDVETEVLAHPHLRDRILQSYRLAQGIAGHRDETRPGFDGFEILRELGRGGMATVYLARRRGDDRKLALKVLPRSVGLSERARRRFLREARALAGLDHPHIVRIHGVIEQGDELGFTMDWIDGSSLRTILERARWRSSEPGSIELEQVLDGAPADARGLQHFVVSLGAAIARGLASVHLTGLVHRDVKPANILVRKDGTPVLVDFGLVHEFESSMTRTGAFVGTPVYAPPEQLLGQELDGRADTHSLGVTLWEALSLRQPFATPRAKRDHALGRGALPRLHRREASRDLATVIEKATAPDPAERYASCTDFADDLERILALQPIRARRPSLPNRATRLARRHAMLLGGVLLGALLVVLVLGPALARATGPSAAERAQEAAERLRAARTALLSFELLATAARRHLALGREPVTAAFDESRLMHALRAYDAAVALTQDPAARLERAVVACAHELTVERHEIGRPLDALPNELPVTRSAARQLTDGLVPSSIANPAIRDAAPPDRLALGLLALLSGDLGLCERAWERLDPVAVDNPLVQAGLGLLFAADGRPQRAYPRLLAARRALPEAELLTLHLADTALALDEVELAERWLAGFSVDGVSRTTLWLFRRLRADVLSARGDYATARIRYQALLRENPNASLVGFRLAQLSLVAGDLEDAATRFEALVAANPGVAAYRLALARVALRRGDRALYLAQVRYVIAEEYGVRRSAGSIRDFLEILRIGELNWLYQRALQRTGVVPPLERAEFLSKSLVIPGGSTSQEVEALLERWARFEHSVQALDLAATTRLESEVARVVAVFLHLTRDFPEILDMLPPTTRFLLPWSSRVAGAHWPAVRSSIHAVLIGLGLAGATAAQHTLLTLNSTRGLKLGGSVAVIGDIDGDQYPDLAAKQDGSAMVFSGSDGKLIKRITIDITFNFASGIVYGPGDVDKDGIPDLAVSNPSDGNNNSKAGAVWVFSGAWIRNGKTPQTLHKWTGGSGDNLGGSLAAADLDRDGHPDIITAAGQSLISGPGYVRAYSGRTGSVLYTANGTLAAPLRDVQLMGDANLDGFPDLLCGASGPPVQILSGKSGSLLHRTSPTGSGIVVGPAGDNNNDGYADIIIGYPRATPPNVSIYSVKDGKTLRSFTNLPSRTGFSPHDIGDVDGDKIADIMLNQTHTTGAGVRIFSGKSLQQIAYMPYGSSGGWFNVRPAGDVNLDGAPDLIAGNYRHDLDAGVVVLFSAKTLSFSTDRNKIPLAQGGSVHFTVDAPAAVPGGSYCFVLGSITGSWPGFRIGSARLPLNPDPYFELTFRFPNVLIKNSLRSLPSTPSRHTARLDVPAGLPAALKGESLHHAFVIIDASTLFVRTASNAVPLLFE